GAEVNLLDVSGWSALHMAACDGTAEVVTWLLQHGASVHVRDKQGQTPLKVAVENDHHKACTVGSEECVKFLLEAGVPTNARDRTDLTPAMCAQVNNHDHLARMIDEQEE
ncbi:fibronectin type 3 and ankyrin repeat domains 1 protein-like, partial [Penaeus indicus]|uniref:fibronectin type 3 and ankyrin repeat domains 1 protein-like n=1 Tax=Penaeus indicus TaxID=29960 RepID=UPI00300CAA25